MALFAAVAVVVLSGIVNRVPKASAQSQTRSAVKSMSFGPDALTSVVRAKKRKLVRMELKTEDDELRAASSGTVLQNFGSFAVVSQSSATKSRSYSDKIIETTVALPGAIFDPIESFRSESIDQASKAGAGYYIVQFGGIATDEWLNDLRSAGVEILQYVPHQAFFVYGESDGIARVASHPRVRWVGRYLSEEKLSPILMEQVAAASADREPGNGISHLAPTKDKRAFFDVAVFARADADSLAAEIRSQFSAISAEVVRLPNNFFNVIRVELPTEKIPAIAAIPDVIRIDSTGVREAEDERASQIVAGNYSNTTTIDPPGYNPLAEFGVDGTGVTVAVADDGVSIPGNGGFYLTSSNTSNGPLRGASAGATSGHGHLNASIIAGSTPFGSLDPLGYNYGLGVAPNSNIVNIPLLVAGYSATDQTSYDDTVSAVGVNGSNVTISNNSWGNGTNMNAYDSYAAQFDGFVRDSSSAASINPLSLIFSAGNSGPSAKSLTRPKVAKNLIAVANSENLRTEFGANGANNMDDLNNTSSRGLAADGRVKPDVTAPGSYITGGRAGNCSGVTNCFDAVHVYSIGTSHAAPQVSGAAALFTQFWRNNNVGQTPSPAMIKAAVINSAQEMNGTNTGTSVPNGDEGWGRLNVKRMFGPGFPATYLDGTNALSDVGSSTVINGKVIDASKPIRATLVWTDPPAVGDPALVNDLDLAVTINGNTYRGNVFSGGVSVTGGTSNSVDNVENVFLLAGTPAMTDVSVSVTAVALNGDGILGNADLTDQNFALVLYNVTPATTAAGADISGRITDQNGVGIPRVTVTLTGSGGVEQSVLTNSFGYYQLTDVLTGRTYIITPQNRKYSFSPQSTVYNHLDQIAGLDFRADAP